MFAKIQFVINFVLLVQILNTFIALSDCKETTTQNSSMRVSHTKAGDYFWDSDHTCGLVNATQSRIRDGVEAELGEFPWMAAMFVTLRPPEQNMTPITLFACGAAIISDYWLITAKHCFRDEKIFLKVEFFVGSIYQYESYTRPPYEMATFESHYMDDITLVRVKNRIRRAFYGDKYRINRVCLPVSDILNHQREEAFMSGFGSIGYTGEKKPYTLRKARYFIESVEECEKRLETFGFSKYRVCALEDKHISCYGDSGSALVQFDGNRAVVIGIVSFHGPNSSVCDSGWIQFVRVSQFIDWIENILKWDSPLDWTTVSPLTDSSTLESTLNSPKVMVNTTNASLSEMKTSVTPEPVFRLESENTLEITTSDCHPLTDPNISIFIAMLLILNIFTKFLFNF